LRVSACIEWIIASFLCCLRFNLGIDYGTKERSRYVFST
jgi:hypothetical protein